MQGSGAGSLVLIVDDDRNAREGLEAILANAAYRFELATNGQEAIDKALALSPDVILLDVMMPEMDGFEVCRRIRERPETAEVPIIILTALDDQQTMLKGLAAGADDFLTKPVNRHELRARVGTITRLNRYRRLLQQRMRIRQLTRQLIDVQEDERRHIAQELHDDLGQSLTTLSISLKMLLDELSDEQKELRAQVADMLVVTRDAFEKMRSLGNGLRPPALDAVGLTPALEGFCRDFSRRTQLPILFSAESEIPTLPDFYNITFYRFLQEALTNVVKHANASQVWVKLAQAPDEVRLSITDDGVGFQRALNGSLEDVVSRQDGSIGMGILGMQERFALLDGVLEIYSQPGQGSRVIGRLPAPADVALAEVAND
jgi:signal transduction histidine kinase